MIHSYAVKFFNGQDWITFKVFTHAEKDLAVRYADYLRNWRDVQIINTVTGKIEYEVKEVL